MPYAKRPANIVSARKSPIPNRGVVWYFILLGFWVFVCLWREAMTKDDIASCRFPAVRSDDVVRLLQQAQCPIPVHALGRATSLRDVLTPLAARGDEVTRRVIADVRSQSIRLDRRYDAVSRQRQTKTPIELSFYLDCRGAAQVAAETLAIGDFWLNKNLRVDRRFD